MIVALLQARLSSSRLPGKVLRPILGAPMLERQIERILRAKSIDKLVLATSADPSDEGIAKLAEKCGIACHRGSLDDVLDRMYQAARFYQPSHLVRLTGDCPLADPDVIDQVIDAHLREDNDYTANGFPPTFPDGLDVEVMKFSAMEAAWRQAKAGAEREHVTLYIYSHPENFKLGNVKSSTDHSHMRWTVDNEADFRFVSEIYERLYPSNPDFRYGDVLRLLAQNPDLSGINAGSRRNEGLEKSLQKDRQKNEAARKKD